MTVSDKPRRKAFGIPQQVGNETSSIEFTLGPLTKPGTKDNIYKCRPTLDGIMLLEFAKIAGLVSDDPDEEISGEAAAASSTAILNLLEDTIEDYPRFRASVRKFGVGAEQLGEIAAWIVESYSERPTP